MALELYNRAIEKGYGPGCRDLGKMYENGEGVRQDLGMAIEMYKRAVELGYEKAGEELERLTHHDDTTEIKE